MAIDPWILEPARFSMRQSYGLRIILVAVVLLGGSAMLWAAGSSKRAKPPKFPATVKDAFFLDAREKLVGDRPSAGGAKAAGPAATTDDAPPESTGNSGGSFAWSKLIDAETLEAETKAIQTAVSKSVTTPDKFKGGGY